ncbi:MAG: RnfABCDGE type electron transport complex subunit D [Oscillospiraceae bacterium]|nr:RnfABCDGE type electron transport complex subunit D [Oscillospiraceae bacterium]
MNKLIIEPNPHIRSSNTTSQIMVGVIIAAIPSIIASTVFFGLKSLILIATCVSACIFFEFAFRLIFKKPHTIANFSAVITGILLAFCLPVTFPLYMAVIGSFVSIVIVKEMFGGIGQNFANPAIVGRIVLMLSFPSYMSNYVEPFFYNHADSSVDVVSSATPLAVEAGEILPSYLDLFLGNHGGTLGETSALALLLGFAYLLCMKIIRWITPVVFVGTVAVGTLVFGGDPLFAVLTGGVLLGAIFMATDYTTNPMTPHGKAIFAFGCGLITVIIRQFGGMPEGVAFSILTMNVLTPLIDRVTKTKPFGADSS